MSTGDKDLKIFAFGKLHGHVDRAGDHVDSMIQGNDLGGRRSRICMVSAGDGGWKNQLGS